MNGPAAAMRRSSLLGFLSILESIKTGLAQPHPKMMSEIMPMGSMCFTGSSVILPRFLAVGSPSAFATAACAYSWKVREIRNASIEIRKSTRKSFMLG